MGCNHEICNRETAVGVTDAEVEFMLLCAVDQGIVEFAGVDPDGTMRYRRVQKEKNED